MLQTYNKRSPHEKNIRDFSQSPHVHRSQDLPRLMTNALLEPIRHHWLLLAPCTRTLPCWCSNKGTNSTPTRRKALNPSPKGSKMIGITTWTCHLGCSFLQKFHSQRKKKAINFKEKDFFHPIFLTLKVWKEVFTFSFSLSTIGWKFFKRQFFDKKKHGFWQTQGRRLDLKTTQRLIDFEVVWVKVLTFGTTSV